WLSPRRAVTVGLDRSIRTWDVETGKQEKVLRLPEMFFPHEFSADAGLVLGRSGEDITGEGLRVLETRTGKQRCAVEVRVAWGARLAFSPDGSWFAYPVKEKQVEVRATSAGAKPRLLTGPDRLVGALAASPDGAVLAAGFEQRLKAPARPRRDDVPFV